jgi:NADH dehydrogenase FAD-containing subunit
MSYSPYCVPLNPKPLRLNRKLRIVCIGAGFAGITIAYKIAHELKLGDIIDLKIYEKQVCSYFLTTSYDNYID